MQTDISYGISQKFVGYRQPKNPKIVNAEHPTVERVLFHSLISATLDSQRLQTYLSIEALGIWTLGMSKLSALFFYRRIFCSTGARDVFNYMTMAFIAIVASWIVIFFVMTFNLCGHHSINWDVKPGHAALCKLTYPYFEATGISDFLLDVIILTLPLPKVRNFPVSPRKTALMLDLNRSGLSTQPETGSSPSRVFSYWPWCKSNTTPIKRHKINT